MRGDLTSSLIPEESHVSTTSSLLDYFQATGCHIFFCKVLDQHWIKFRFLDPDCNFIWFLSQRFGFWISIRFLNQFLIFESSSDFCIRIEIFDFDPKSIFVSKWCNLIPSLFWSPKKIGILRFKLWIKKYSWIFVVYKIGHNLLGHPVFSCFENILWIYTWDIVY